MCSRLALGRNWLVLFTLHYSQVSLGTLLAYTTVAISVLILRYVPPGEVPFPLSFKDAIDSVSSRHTINSSPPDVCVENTKVYAISPENTPLLAKEETPVRCPPMYRGWKCKFI